MATQTFASAAAVDAALIGLSSSQRASVKAAPAANGAFLLTVPDALASMIGSGPTVAQLTARANAKQLVILSDLVVSHALKDEAATLTTKCDPSSMTFLNSLAAWSIMSASSATRAYYNLDGSSHQITPVEMNEFLTTVGAAVQSTFDALAAVISGIAASPPTIKTYADVDAASWPTTAS